MEPYSLEIDYAQDDRKREALYPLFEEVFGIPADLLGDFHQKGFWDSTYCPFTYFQKEKAAANVSMFSMPLLVEGKCIRAAGIQSVMTHPDHRGKGLMKKLFHHMLERLDQTYDCALLMTNQPGLYIPFGFQEAEQYSFKAAFMHPGRINASLKRLDLFQENGLTLTRHLFEKRQPLSERFWPMRYQSSFYLNMYSPFFQERVYYSEDLNAILIYEVKEGILKLYDILAEKIPAMDDLAKQIPEAFNQIECHFCPDRFNDVDWTVHTHTSRSKLMVRGMGILRGKRHRLPMTAEF